MQRLASFDWQKLIAWRLAKLHVGKVCNGCQQARVDAYAHQADASHSSGGFYLLPVMLQERRK